MDTTNRTGGVSGALIRFPRFEVLRIDDFAEPGVVFYEGTPTDEELKTPHPNNPNLVKCLTVMYCTKGSWKIDMKLHPEGGFTMETGSGFQLFRYKSRARLTAMGPGLSGWVCIRPLDNTFWLRSLVKVAAGESISFEKSTDVQYLFVVYGSVQSDKQHIKNEMIMIPAGTQPNFTAETDATLIRLYL